MGKGGLGSILGEGVLWFPRQREELERDHDFEGRDQAGQQAWGASKAQRPPGGARMWFSEEEGQRVFTVRQPWLRPHDCRPALGPVLDSAANIALQRVASRPHI